MIAGTGQGGNEGGRVYVVREEGRAEEWVEAARGRRRRRRRRLRRRRRRRRRRMMTTQKIKHKQQKED